MDRVTLSHSLGPSIIILIFGILLTAPVFALNKSQSAEYSRTLSRNATTHVDASFYNPAGLAFLQKEGFHLALSNFAIHQRKSILDKSELLASVGLDQPYASSATTFVYPGVHAAYRRGDWTIFGNFLPVGGGGGGSFENGLPLFDTLILNEIQKTAGVSPTAYHRDMLFTGVAYNLGTTLGIAYRVHDRASISLGYRLTYTVRQTSGKVENLSVGIGETTLTGEEFPDLLGDAGIEIDGTGMSHTLILGFHLRPLEGLNIGFHAELSGALEVENNTTFTGNPNLEALFSTTSFADGAISDVRESPFVMAGISYQLLPELLISSSLFVALNSQSGATGYGPMIDSYFSSIGLEYDITGNLIWGMGYANGTPWLLGENRSDLTFALQHHYLATGLSYPLFQRWQLNVGAILDWATTSEDQTSAAPEGGTQVRTENLMAFSVGLSYSP